MSNPFNPLRRARKVAVATLLCAFNGAAAQARPRVPVRRAGTAAEILAARDEAVRKLTGFWTSTTQAAMPSESPCELRLASERKALDVVTHDVQTVDVGLLSAETDDISDLDVGGVRISMTKPTHAVIRKRYLTVEGVDRPVRTERTNSLLILGESRSEGRIDRLTAVIGWSAKCEVVK